MDGQWMEGQSTYWHVTVKWEKTGSPGYEERSWSCEAITVQPRRTED